jgi:hypothetical protein
MTATQIATCAAADAILNAPQAHIDADPPACLLELVEVCLEHLDFQEVGIGGRIIDLTLLKDKIEKDIAPELALV